MRRPGASIYGKIGLQDFTTDDVYFERGINLLHGYLTEYYVEDSDFVFPLPETLRASASSACSASATTSDSWPKRSTRTRAS